MKIFNSIRWRLQIWYGLILVVVLAGFGFAAYQLERNRQFRRIDDELQRRFGVLANALRPPPRRPDENGQPFDRPPRGRFPGDGPPGQSQGQPREFHLPPQATALFDTNNPNNFYFSVFGHDEEIARSENQPQEMIKNNPTSSALLGPPRSQIFGNVQEILKGLPSGEMIKVGCSIAPELKELRLTALKLTGSGGIILFFGLAGGWWFVSRALRPIENISAAAVKISAGDLSQRINIADAENELGRLAAVLNSTFARLDAAFAQQKQFASDAAHELRTPVSVMLTQTQMTLNRERSAPEYRETIESCQRAAQRMRRLIESLLELARLDAGQEQLKRLPFDLSRTVRDCVELIRPLADERGVKIIPNLAAIEYVGDAERLAQVIANLLTNAIQYNQPDGEVRIAAQSQNGTVILTVSDTGAGISAEDLPRVFERFYCADKARSAGHTGLGLAISKAIVEAHGGTIEVSSQLDFGTTLTVRLPTS
jgi:heavy metal sensor kinase